MDFIAKATKRLIDEKPFFGMFMLSLSRVYSNKYPAAAAVGLQKDMSIKLIFNPDMLEKMTPENVKAVICHELLHVIYNHLFQSKRYPDHKLANIAMDLCINSVIRDEYSMQLPEMVLFPERYQLEKGKDTQWYYNELLNMKDDIDKKLKAADNNKKAGGNGNPNFTEGEGNLHNDITQDGTSPWDHHWDEVNGLSDVEKVSVEGMCNSLVTKISEEVKNIPKYRGTIPANIQRILDELEKLNMPSVNWKSFFKGAVGSSIDIKRRITRTRQSKRFKGSPGTIKRRKCKVLFGIDTSGSMGPFDIAEAFSEVKHLWNSGVDVDIAECDTDIKRVYKYEGKTPEFILGGGGTNISPFIDHFNDKIHEYTTLVILTDGHHERPMKSSVKRIIHLVTSKGAPIENFSNLPYYTIKMDNL